MPYQLIFSTKKTSVSLNLNTVYLWVISMIENKNQIIIILPNDYYCYVSAIYINQ